VRGRHHLRPKADARQLSAQRLPGSKYLSTICGHYALVRELKELSVRFKALATIVDLPWLANRNIKPGDMVPVITSQQPRAIEFIIRVHTRLRR
jgi:hypothetical protein